MAKNKLLYVGYGADNRTKNSGYEHIVDFRDEDYEVNYLDAANLPFGFIPTGKRGKRINLYFLEIVSHMKANHFDIIHNFSCDNQLLFKHPLKRTYAAVATTHLNYHDFTTHQLSVLSSYDAVIVLSKSEEEYLKRKGINSYYIPHGFSKPIFQKNDSILKKHENKINVCFSGVCYRDYKVLWDFISLIKHNENVVLHVLGQRAEIKRKLRELQQKNVLVYDFLSDNDYYSIMEDCDYNFLPLTFATANNTLLEAEFLGIKSIIPNIDGISDYAEKNSNLFYQNHEDLIKIVASLRKQKHSNELIAYSKKFEWKDIYSKTKDLYDKILKEKV